MAGRFVNLIGVVWRRIVAMRWRLPICLAVVLALILLHQRAQAAQRVSLELVLAIDVSLSVNDIEYGLQMDGIAAAFGDPEVTKLIEAHKNGVAVFMTLWSGTREANVPLSWRLLRSGRDAAQYAELVRQVPRPRISNFTALGHAVSFAIEQLGINEFAGEERTIDVSGDGRNNTGPEPWTLKPLAVEHGITINGLTIVNNEEGLTSYYQRDVISGSNSFVISAQDFSDFGQAFRRKLVRELNARIAGHSAPFNMAWHRR